MGRPEVALGSRSVSPRELDRIGDCVVTAQRGVDAGDGCTRVAAVLAHGLCVPPVLERIISQHPSGPQAKDRQARGQRGDVPCRWLQPRSSRGGGTPVTPPPPSADIDDKNECCERYPV